jgi:hypothetical protein
MNYLTGEEVQLHDRVEYIFGGQPYGATVVFICETGEAAGGYAEVCHSVRERHGEGQLGIEWDEPDPDAPPDLANYLVTDADEDLRFLRRVSNPSS